MMVKVAVAAFAVGVSALPLAQCSRPNIEAVDHQHPTTTVTVLPENSPQPPVSEWMPENHIPLEPDLLAEQLEDLSDLSDVWGPGPTITSDIGGVQ